MRFNLMRNGVLPIPAKVIDQIRTAARSANPRETCGLLLGREGRITMVREARNVHPTPATHFEIDPQALIDAYREEREGGLQLLGYFHSHPTGDAVPSRTDEALRAGDGKVWAIVAGSDVRFWLDAPKGFCPLSYEVVGR